MKKKTASVLISLLIFGGGFLVKKEAAQALTYNNNPYFNGVMDAGFTRANGGGDALEQNVAELVKDGLYQAYCAATVERHTDFTPADYEAIRLDFTNAYMSLLRNKNGEDARLSSTEAYFGYVEPLENVDLQAHNIKNNFYSNITELTQQCVTRVQMLRAIWNVCETKEGDEPFVLREQCNSPDCLFAGENPGALTSCDLYEEGRYLGETNYDIKELIDVYLLQKEMPEKCPYTDPEKCCHYLVTSKAPKDSEEGQVRDAMGSLPFYANDTYRLGYVLESAKLCQPCQLELPTDNCSDEDSNQEYGAYCSPEEKWNPDRLRSYQMLLPNVVTNAHYNKPESNYVDPSHFVYQAVTMQGAKPKDWVATGQEECEAGVNDIPTLDLAQQDTDWQTTCNDKWDTLNGDSSYDNIEPINRRLYQGDTSEKSTLALLVNKTATYNTFNTRYLEKEAFGSMRCGTNLVSSNANKRNVVSDANVGKNTDPSATEYHCKTWYRNGGTPEWTDCGQDMIYSTSGQRGDCMKCGVDYTVCNNDDCWCTLPGEWGEDWARCTYADIKWWAVTPNGYDSEKIENGIRSLYAQWEGWDELEDVDPRLTKRVGVVDYTGGPRQSQISVLAGGPATDVFGVMKFLYPYESEVWKKMQSYANLEDYYIGSGGAGYTPGESNNPNAPININTGYTADGAGDPDGVKAQLCKQWGDAYKAGGGHIREVAGSAAEFASQAIAMTRAESGMRPNAIGCDSRVRSSGNCPGSAPSNSYCTGTAKDGNYASTGVGLYQITGCLTDAEVAAYQNPQTNITKAIEYVEGRGWCPWAVYTTGSYSWGCTTGANQAWMKPGRGNYANNAEICIDDGAGGAKYNPAGDCGQSGIVDAAGQCVYR